MGDASIDCGNNLKTKGHEENYYSAEKPTHMLSDTKLTSHHSGNRPLNADPWTSGKKRAQINTANFF
jgi:hypothetical protein